MTETERTKDAAEPKLGEREQRLEIELRESQEARLRLAAEVLNQHRNTLAVIRSILHRTAARCTSVADLAQHLEARLGAYGRAQAAALRDPGSGVDFAALLADELLVYAVHEGSRLTLSGPALRLQPRAAELFALVFNELALNAVKFGALRNGQGRIAVHWDLCSDGDGRYLQFRWVESGMNEPRTPQAPGGFGTELLERNLRYELDAEGILELLPPGMECRIRAPANARLLIEA